MVKIELRQDDWFEAGADFDPKTFPHLIYVSKQIIKKMLTSLSERDLSYEAFRKSLGEITVDHFKGSPYIRGNDIVIDTHGLPGECYLGNILE